MTRLFHRTLTLLGVTALGLTSLGCFPVFVPSKPDSPTEDLSFEYIDGDEASDNYLLELRINGPILHRDVGPGFLGVDGGVTYAYAFQRVLEKAAEDDRVAGILLRLSTPGGTIVGSSVIYRALEDYKAETGNPIVAYVDGISASGGVWTMVAADEIYAAPGSIVGSIGVIGPSFVYFDDPIAVDGGLLGGGVTTRNGIQQFVISAGKGKDLGNPFRLPTEEELQVLQRNIANEYDNFVAHVAATREIPEAQIRDEMGAYIFDTETAEALGLIDGTDYQEAAIAALATRAELDDDFQLVRVERSTPSLLAVLLGQAPAARADETLQAQIEQDLCDMTTQAMLVYYGNVSTLCPAWYFPQQQP